MTDLKNRLITQSLHETAHEEIPDTMNLLPEIHSQLAGVRRRSRSLSLLIVVVLMFAVSTTVFAIVSSQIGDPGLEGARANNLITDVNQTQTIDGVTVKLEWAYADAQRIAFGYSVTAPEENIYYNTTDLRLYDDANSFVADGGGGGGGGEGVGRESQYMTSYNITFADDAPEELVMHVDLTLLPVEQMEVGISGFGGGSGGGGGGATAGGAVIPPGAVESTPEVGDSLPSVGPFEFTFTLPHYPEISVETEQTVESNDVTLTLKSVRVVPSMTVAEVCYTLPDDRDWSPVLTLRAGDADTAVAGWGLNALPTPEDRERCVTYEFYAPYDYTPITFTFSASELRTSASYTPERAEAFRQLLAEQGVEVTITQANGEGFGYEITDQPEGDVGQLIQTAMETAFSDHYAGNWTFTVEIPGLEN
ncbi:MAG: DUF4179 domain-containing protein [Chloroflexi bacterium]|uniref:DUF4179 domain-containing protein n=1 Tax=Candidatus Flexifilum breve TaxID=3140694 RepID=UPI003136AEE3|nr:DUF4179 domain-containing protein [Chloroflexota bacterium]